MNVVKKTLKGLLIFGILSIVFRGLPAQTANSTLFVVVNDSSNRAVANVHLELSGQSLGINRASLTNEKGESVFTAINPGQYQLTAFLEGFRKEIYSEVVLEPGLKTSLWITLIPSVSPEEIVVTAEKYSSPVFAKQLLSSHAPPV